MARPRNANERLLVAIATVAVRDGLGSSGAGVPFRHNRPDPAFGERRTHEGTIRLVGYDVGRGFRMKVLRRLEVAELVEVEREYGQLPTVRLTTAGVNELVRRQLVGHVTGWVDR